MSVAERVREQLEELPEDELLMVIEAVVRARGRTHTGEVTEWLRLAMQREHVTEQLAGPALRVHSSLDEAYGDLRIQVAARRAVLGHDMLDASGVADALGHRGVNTRELASGLRRKGDIVGLREGNRYVYPAFQFDPVAARVPTVVVNVNHHLDAAHDPWAVASWWMSPNPRLHWKEPSEFIGTDSERDVLVLAGVHARVTE